MMFKYLSEFWVQIVENECLISAILYTSHLLSSTLYQSSAILGCVSQKLQQSSRYYKPLAPMVSMIYLNFQYFGKHICGLTLYILKNPICLFYILLKWLLQPLIIHRLLTKLSQYRKSRTIYRRVCSHDAGQSRWLLPCPISALTESIH